MAVLPVVNLCPEQVAGLFDLGDTHVVAFEARSINGAGRNQETPVPRRRNRRRTALPIQSPGPQEGSVRRNGIQVGMIKKVVPVFTDNGKRVSGNNKIAVGGRRNGLRNIGPRAAKGARPKNLGRSKGVFVSTAIAETAMRKRMRLRIIAESPMLKTWDRPRKLRLRRDTATEFLLLQYALRTNAEQEAGSHGTSCLREKTPT